MLKYFTIFVLLGLVSVESTFPYLNCCNYNMDATMIFDVDLIENIELPTLNQDMCCEMCDNNVLCQSSIVDMYNFKCKIYSQTLVDGIHYFNESVYQGGPIIGVGSERCVISSPSPTPDETCSTGILKNRFSYRCLLF